MFAFLSDGIFWKEVIDWSASHANSLALARFHDEESRMKRYDREKKNFKFFHDTQILTLTMKPLCWMNDSIFMFFMFHTVDNFYELVTDIQNDPHSQINYFYMSTWSVDIFSISKSYLTIFRFDSNNMKLSCITNWKRYFRFFSLNFSYPNFLFPISMTQIIRIPFIFRSMCQSHISLFCCCL